jgi:ribonuclease HI
MTDVELYTDGACSGNPGPGGWGAILVIGGKELVLSGSTDDTTNNQMELTAVIEGLRSLTLPCRVTITADSTYVINGFAKGWLAKWKSNGWKTSARKPVKNQELWQALDHQIERHTVTWVWVRGHEGHELNERCDRMAVAAYEALMAEPKLPAVADR